VKTTDQEYQSCPAPDLSGEAILFHQLKHGKIEVVSKMPVKNEHDLAIIYTPGVAEPCKLIHRNKELVYDYTDKGNLVAVVSDVGLPTANGKKRCGK